MRCLDSRREFAAEEIPGGGQPSDQGFLTLLDNPDAERIAVTKVQREGLRCIIYSPQPLQPGDRVLQEVDWEGRFDHMQQHTGQHLLSAIMEREFGLKTVGWGMGLNGAMNYVDITRKPTQEQMLAIQKSCSEEIRNNSAIQVHHPEDAHTGKLPGDYDKSEGLIRVIKIGEIDNNTWVFNLKMRHEILTRTSRCCGTHLRQTSHISLILLGSTQSVHGKNCRLFFAAGDRATRLAQSSFDAVGAMAKLMSSSAEPSEVVVRTTAMNNAVSELKRSEKQLLLEIADYEIERVKGVLASRKSALVHRSNGGVDFISRIIAGTKDALRGTELVVVLAIGEPKTSGPVVVVGDKNAVEAMIVRVKEAVKNIKGGGAGEKWQGKVPEWQKEDLKALKELFPK